MTENSTKTPYELIGGESIVLRLVDRFYFYMDTLPEADGIRKLHAHDLSSSKAKLFKFLSGWLGACPRIEAIARESCFESDFSMCKANSRLFNVVIGKSGQNQLFRSRLSILGQAPRWA